MVAPPLSHEYRAFLRASMVALVTNGLSGCLITRPDLLYKKKINPMTRFAPNFAAASRGNLIKRNRDTAPVYLMMFRKLLKIITVATFL